MIRSRLAEARVRYSDRTYLVLPNGQYLNETKPKSKRDQHRELYRLACELEDAQKDLADTKVANDLLSKANANQAETIGQLREQLVKANERTCPHEGHRADCPGQSRFKGICDCGKDNPHRQGILAPPLYINEPLTTRQAIARHDQKLDALEARVEALTPGCPACNPEGWKDKDRG